MSLTHQRSKVLELRIRRTKKVAELIVVLLHQQVPADDERILFSYAAFPVNPGYRSILLDKLRVRNTLVLCIVNDGRKCAGKLRQWVRCDA